MPTKNDPMIIDTTSLLGVSSELFSIIDIITLPAEANYSYQETLNVLLHAATSSSNSLESASNDLRSKIPNLRIPSADTIFNYIKSNSTEDVLSSFRKINNEIFEMMNLKNNVHDIAVDFHDKAYYGSRDTPLIRGIKPKNGTSWGYSFCTLDIIGNSKLTFDVIDINGLSKDYSILMDSLFERIENMGVKVGTVYMDREFFNKKVISKMDEHKLDFVIAAKSNKRIKGILEKHTKENGNTSTVFEYRFLEGGPTFNIIAMWDQEKGYILFATNKKVGMIDTFVKQIPEEYRKRWNIETGYRVKNDFKIRTCSKSPVARTLFFVIQCIMYNILNVLKSVLEITAYQMKSVINQDIIKAVTDGIESLCNIPVKLFLDYLMKFNRERSRALRARLRDI
ncbi:MAG: ISH3 family transposase [Methanosarcina sp.]|uniref:ISH3 family transposase n=1 Tax=Methanosarcina sp. TaxID=2213 RepID=UPI002610FBE5|nr:ISH3 family transposase [Methanosarcina sp.]MDD3246463.1 ISH3 family transposase [Methanosarcina sp.]